MLSFFPRDVLDEILNLIESVSEGFSFLLLYYMKQVLSPKVVFFRKHGKITQKEQLNMRCVPLPEKQIKIWCLTSRIMPAKSSVGASAWPSGYRS